MSNILDTLITDRTGGYYNLTDLNRVGTALNYVRDELVNDCGYVLSWTAKTDWTVGDIQNETQMQNYLNYVESCRSIVNATPSTPDSMDDLTVGKANDIEKILVACGDAIDRLKRSLFYSGEIYCGEV